MKNRFFSSNLVAALALILLAGAGRANAALQVVTPGEQNTQSGENGCALGTTCGAGHWLHYPELLQMALGAGYVVHNNGDGGAVLGCDATTATVAGGGSFCKSGTYTASLTPTPDIVIIGPFGEHDQRIVGASAANTTNLYMESVFEAAYEGLVQKYLKGTTKVYMMTPIDITWGGTPNLPAGDDLVKNVMLPAAMKVATNHQIPIIDTYTAVGMSFYAADGQVNAAGQMKMAMLIEAALASGGAGGAGGTSGAGGAGGAGGTTGAAGTTGTGGTTGAAGAGTGTAGTTGTGTGTAGTTGTATGTAGTTGSGTGTAGTTGSATGAAGTTGAAGAATGAAGSAATGTGTGTAGSGPGPYGKGSSGGCAYASPTAGGALGVAALGMLAAVVLGRRRKRRR